MATELVSRAAAGLRPPTGTSTNIRPEMVTAHYGGDSSWGAADRSSPARFAATTDHDRCAPIWRGWQAFHMGAQGWTDLAYTSAGCPHGVRYEGRGPGRRTAANGTNDGNLRSYAVVYIAGGNDPVTDGAKHAFLDEALRLGVPLAREHSQWKSTSCAGHPIRAWQAAGWRRPGGPPPGPHPPPLLPPPIQEDDDMPIIITADKLPAALLSGNELVQFGDQATLGALAGAGVRRAHVSVADYHRFNRGFSQGGDPAAAAKLTEIAGTVGAIGMYAAALHTLELAEAEREERRDAGT